VLYFALAVLTGTSTKRPVSPHSSGPRFTLAHHSHVVSLSSERVDPDQLNILLHNLLHIVHAYVAAMWQ
jgi:hypothetical protein